MSDPEPVVFVVDDDASIREALTSLIRSVGLGVETFGSAREFLNGQRPDAPGCLVLDVRLPGLSGLDLQRELAASVAELVHMADRLGLPAPRYEPPYTNV
jgi:FixJ family two-component response regulator